LGHPQERKPDRREKKIERNNEEIIMMLRDVRGHGEGSWEKKVEMKKTRKKKRLYRDIESHLCASHLNSQLLLPIMYICNNKYHLCFLMASNIKEISLR
jgi:hypothetical protein